MYSTVTIHNLMTQLQSATAAIWYVDICDYSSLSLVIELPSEVLFDFDSAELHPEALEMVDLVADLLRRYPDSYVEIEGHTCNLGSNQYNQGLSERRALSVYDYLLEHEGIDSNRMEWAGMGETHPRYTNRSEDFRSKNRRVEFLVLGIDEPQEDLLITSTNRDD